ncbi:hypothetical protein ES288_D01G246900v1 [Gossypium darwinii]|uniref:Uncharacterized protein n=1 Tax=Gossypium darwinii TaxID=34276 RepID=A0A5D2DTJ2_GOSDA|nr:hypothetical protein ES288_D01G246900v1 [Gossypium darwinii]
MQLTLIPCSPNCTLKLFVNPATACFDALCAWGRPMEIFEARLAVKSMQPFLNRTMTLAAYLAPKKPPNTLTSNTLLKSLAACVTLTSLSPGMPALLNMISSFPYLDTAKFTAFWTSDSHVTSQWT